LAVKIGWLHVDNTVGSPLYEQSEGGRMMGTQPEADAQPDHRWIDLWPDNTMAETCAEITRLIRDDGYELREVVFCDRGGLVYAVCDLVKPKPQRLMAGRNLP
jgi:hypothetical protein